MKQVLELRETKLSYLVLIFIHACLSTRSIMPAVSPLRKSILVFGLWGKAMPGQLGPWIDLAKTLTRSPSRIPRLRLRK